MRTTSPFFDSSFTQKRLGYVPTPLDEGLNITISAELKM